MTSHEFAIRLLELPDLPVATHANNHTYFEVADHCWEGLRIGKLETYLGDYLLVGNFDEKVLQTVNWRVAEVYFNGGLKERRDADGRD